MVIEGKSFELNAPVAISRLVEMARKSGHAGEADEGLNEDLCWGHEWRKLGHPFTFRFIDYYGEGEVLPGDVFLQLVGQKLSRGLHFTFLGKECYVIDVSFIRQHYFTPKLIVQCGDTITEKILYRVGCMDAVETRFIDMKK